MGKKSRNRSEIITVKTLLEPNKSHRPMSKQSTVICYPPHDTGSWTLTSGWSHTNEKSSEVLGGFGGLAQAKVTRCPCTAIGEKLCPVSHGLVAAARRLGSAEPSTPVPRSRRENQRGATQPMVVNYSPPKLLPASK